MIRFEIKYFPAMERGRLWIAFVLAGLTLACWHALVAGRSVDDFPVGYDPFGYLQSAKEIRSAFSDRRLPDFWIKDLRAEKLVAFFKAKGLPPDRWGSLCGPWTYNYQPRNGKVVVQYPPGTGLLLSLFPEGQAVKDLNTLDALGLLLVGGWGLIRAFRLRACVSAGFVAIVIHLALDTLRGIHLDSFSINALMVPLALSIVLLFFGPKKGEGFRWAVSGGLFGFCFLCRIPVLFLLPGMVLAAWAVGQKKGAAWFVAGWILFGAVPILVHQQRATGAWYASTYGGGDTVPPNLGAMLGNIRYYLLVGGGSRYNWELLLLLAGCGGLAWRRRLVPPGSSETLPDARVGAAAAVVWGVPAAYFLLHPVHNAYYVFPSSFGAALTLAFGTLAVQRGPDPSATSGAPARFTPGWKKAAAVFLAALPAVAMSAHAWGRLALPPGGQLPRGSFYRTIPADLSADRAWVWGGVSAGTVYYYTGTPAFSATFVDREILRDAYEFVVGQGDTLYLIDDGPMMRLRLDWVRQWGGSLERAGVVSYWPYYRVHPEDGRSG